MLEAPIAVMLIIHAVTSAALLGIASCQASTTYLNGTVNNDSPVVLKVSTDGVRNATAPLLYGWMIEDINHSIDGGLYAEMITNRAFQGSTVNTGKLEGFNSTVIISSENPLVPFGPVLTGYRPIGGARLSLDRLHPLSPSLPTVMKVEIPLNASGEVGFLNEGWWGMDVSPQTYNASFYVKANGPFDAANITSVNVSLRSNLTKDIWCTKKIPACGISDISYTQLKTQLTNKATAPNSNNTFAITFNGSEIAGKTFYFSLISLFPETYKGRSNGLRKDLGRKIKDLNPKILRFGGNNMEGYSIDSRWKWNETIGPLIDRPGRPGTWEYYNTDGFGLLEFLEWTEDMELEPVLGIYAGYSLSITGGEGASFPQGRMNEVLESALDELEYCMGNTSTPFGALRAAHGHAEPFQINYIEIGNEDFFSGTYPRRFAFLSTALKIRYPNITIISTAYNENAEYNISIPPGSIYDLHHYAEPTFFLEQFNFFDNWGAETKNANVSIFVGEYSVPSVDEPTGKVNFSDPLGPHIFYPQLLSALAESVYLLAMERNPVVKMSAYAPSLQNWNWWNWTPNLLAFDADPSHTVLSTSWYLQRLFAHYRGTHTLPVTNVAGDFNPLFWVATIDESLNAIYLKVRSHLVESAYTMLK